MAVDFEGPHDARVVVLGEAPGSDEVRAGRPFVGRSGRLLDFLLASAGIDRRACLIGNVCREQPPGNEIAKFFGAGPVMWGKRCRPPIEEGVKALYAQLRETRPHVVLTLGDTAMWSLTSKWGITKWRGSMLRGELLPCKVVPTLHPAAILRLKSPRAMSEAQAVVLEDYRRAVREREALDWVVEPPAERFVIGPNPVGLESVFRSVLERLEAAPTRLSIDIETAVGHIESFGIAVSREEAVCVPFVRGAGESYWSAEAEAWVVQWLRFLCTHKNARCVGHNLNYDCQHIARHWRWVPRVTDDTMIMIATAFPGGGSPDPMGKRKAGAGVTMRKSLDFCSSLFRPFHVYWKGDRKHYDRFGQQDDETQWRYNCIDTTATYELADIFERLLGAMNLTEQYRWRMRAWPVAFRMTLRGVGVNRERKERVALECRERIAELERRLGALLPPQPGKKPWYDSPVQTAGVLYDRLGLPEQHSKGGGRTADDGALTRLLRHRSTPDECQPVLESLKELREIRGLLNNFVNASLSEDGRLRSSFDIAGTETFRWASRKDAFDRGTNLQNLQKDEDD